MLNALFEGQIFFLFSDERPLLPIKSSVITVYENMTTQLKVIHFHFSSNTPNFPSHISATLGFKYRRELLSLTTVQLTF